MHVTTTIKEILNLRKRSGRQGELEEGGIGSGVVVKRIYQVHKES